jgi:hypothetical protein
MAHIQRIARLENGSIRRLNTVPKCENCKKYDDYRNARMVRREVITMKNIKKEWKEEIKERLIAEILKATNAEENAEEVEQIINKFFKDYIIQRNIIWDENI